MRVVHFSDIHYGSEIPEVVQGLEDAVRAIRPDLIIASGDFTMAGRRCEFRRAARLISRFGAPVLATPGNHDIPAYRLFLRFFRPLARYRRFIGEITSGWWVSDELAAIGVNTARPWDLSWDWSHGAVSLGQVDEVDRFFSRHGEGRHRILVVHHPFIVPDDMPAFRAIRNGGLMLETLARHRVHLVLAGHLHRQFDLTRRIDLDTGPWDVTLLQVGTVTSHRHRNQPNGFNELELTPGGIRVKQHLWKNAAFRSGEARAFEPVSEEAVVTGADPSG